MRHASRFTYHEEESMREKTAKWLSFLSVAIGLIGFVGLVSAPAQARPPINCRIVLCAYPDCLPNEHTVIPPGQCCPVCVPNK